VHDSIQWLSRCPKCTGIAKDSSQGPHNMLWGERHPIYMPPPQTTSPPQGIIWDGPAIINPPLHHHHHLHIHDCHNYCPERVCFILSLCCACHLLASCHHLLSSFSGWTTAIVPWNHSFFVHFFLFS